MQTKRERLANNDYVWKVLMPECFIKFYMDFFQVDKEEAEKRKEIMAIVLIIP